MSVFLVVSTASVSGEPDTIAYLADHKAPLIVSLHEWSSDWQQYDALAPLVADAGFHYIHPNHQGANHHPDACLSEAVVRDIDKAIEWAVSNADVDQENILVTGLSGGGYTALGYRTLTKRRLKHTFAWAAITDLDRWYFESKDRENKYADDILGCIGGQYDQSLLLARSPLHLNENSNGAVTLFAGINDGYEGSVPVSHSIMYFDKLVDVEDRIESDLFESLVNRTVKEVLNVLAGRDVYLDRIANDARIVIFEGGHEMLSTAAIEEIKNKISP